MACAGKDKKYFPFPTWAIRFKLTFNYQLFGSLLACAASIFTIRYATPMNKLLFTFLLFGIFPTAVAAQSSNRKLFKGKVTAYANNIDGIYVINLTTQDATTTQGGGYFSLAAQVGDTLMLSSIQFKAFRYAVTAEDSDKELVFIRMTPIMNQLNEVMIYQYKNINAVALGIIPKSTKTYTPAERKLKTATGWAPQNGGVVSIDPLFNLLSGRSAMLKKELVVEGKETLLQRIDDLYEKEFFTQKLKIPTEYVRGFQYYLVEKDRFAKAINAKNKTLATFLMGEYAVKYLEIIASEKN